MIRLLNAAASSSEYRIEEVDVYSAGGYGGFIFKISRTEVIQL